MSKEIYIEYVNKYFFECATYEEKKTLNDGYIWNRGAVMTFSEYNENVGAVCDSFFMVDSSDYKFIARKPKTQIINGHEVVAPCYEHAENGELIYVFNPFKERGVRGVTYTPNMIFACRNFGFFYDRDDAIAYANAHRENKND